MAVAAVIIQPAEMAENGMAEQVVPALITLQNQAIRMERAEPAVMLQMINTDTAVAVVPIMAARGKMEYFLFPQQTL